MRQSECGSKPRSRAGTPLFEPHETLTIKSVCSTMRRLRVPALSEIRSNSNCAPRLPSVSAGWFNDCQERRKHRQMLNVVEAYQRHVFGHRYATLAQRLHSADRGHVVDGENCRGQRGEAENLLRRAIPAYLIDGRAKHQVLAIGNTGGGQCFLDSPLMPFCAPVEVSSTSVTCAMSR